MARAPVLPLQEMGAGEGTREKSGEEAPQEAPRQAQPGGGGPDLSETESTAEAREVRGRPPCTHPHESLLLDPSLLPLVGATCARPRPQGPRVS